VEATRAVQVDTDSPLALLKAIARQHFGPSIWLAFEDMSWLYDPHQVPRRVGHAYAEQAATTPVNLDTYRARRIRLLCKDGSTFGIVALIAPEPAGDKSVLALTEDGEAIVLQQTHAAIHDNGVTQVYGAEPGVVIITQDVLRRSTRGPFLKGHQVERCVREVLTTDGWKGATDALIIPSGIIKSLA